MGVESIMVIGGGKMTIRIRVALCSPRELKYLVLSLRMEALLAKLVNGLESQESFLNESNTNILRMR